MLMHSTDSSSIFLAGLWDAEGRLQGSGVVLASIQPGAQRCLERANRIPKGRSSLLLSFSLFPGFLLLYPPVIRLSARHYRHYPHEGDHLSFYQKCLPSRVCVLNREDASLSSEDREGRVTTPSHPSMHRSSDPPPRALCSLSFPEGSSFLQFQSFDHYLAFSPFESLATSCLIKCLCIHHFPHQSTQLVSVSFMDPNISFFLRLP